MLSIRNLHANIDGKEILRGINLDIRAGEVHAIMGPNGSGKSTLSAVIAGREDYEVTEGTVEFAGKDLQDYIAMVLVWFATEQNAAITNQVNFENVSSRLQTLEKLIDGALEDLT